MNMRNATESATVAGQSTGKLVEVGGMLFSSSVTGIDPALGLLSRQADEQVRTAFDNLKKLLQQGKVSPAELGLVTISITDRSSVRHVDECWSALFPDSKDQPSRKINKYGLPAGELIEIQVIGVRKARRKFIAVPSLSSPCAFGVKLGKIAFSSVIEGIDPATGLRSDDRLMQMRQAFHNMESFVRAAGGTKEDIIHVFIFVRGRDDQKDMLSVWLEEFPEDGRRPARKAIFDETLAVDSKIIYLMCVAVLGENDRTNLEVPGISKRHPNPMGCRIGNIVYSSGIGGDDPTGRESSNGVGARAALAFQNMKTLVEVGGGNLSDIGLVSITVNDYADEKAIIDQWRKIFPDPDVEPARHVMAFGGRGSYPVQLHVIAAMGHR